MNWNILQDKYDKIKPHFQGYAPEKSFFAKTTEDDIQVHGFEYRYSLEWYNLKKRNNILLLQ